MIEDMDLLRSYVNERSESAFAELVRRRIGLVYSVAQRHTRDVHLAEDATQTVFVDLARKAASLARGDALVGWLHRSAHHAALNIMRAEWSRSAREQEVQRRREIFADDQPPEAWEKARPILDEVLSELEARDRDAVLLRFIDGHGFAEVGARLGLSENTARMRVERALDKLQAGFARRRLTCTTAVLATVLAQQANAAVPAGLVGAVSGAALASAASHTAPALTLLQLMSTTKMVVGAGGLVAAMAIIGAGYGFLARRAADGAFAAVKREQIVLAARLQQEESAASSAEARAAKIRRAAEAEARRATATAAAKKAAMRHANWNPESEGRALLERYPELRRWVQDVADAGFQARFGGFGQSIGLKPEQIEQLKRLCREWSHLVVPFDGETVALPAGTGMTWNETVAAMRALLGEVNFAKMRDCSETANDRRLAAQATRLAGLIGENRSRGKTGQPQVIDWDKGITGARTQLSAEQLAALEALRSEAAQEALSYE